MGEELREEMSFLRLAKVYKGPLFCAYVALVMVLLYLGPQLAGFSKTTTAAAKGEGAAKKSSMADPPVIIAFSPYPPMMHPIRLGLQTRVSSIRLVVWTPGAVFVNGRAVFALKPAMVYSLSPGKITELATGQTFPLPFDQRAIVAAPDYRVWANNRWWRGCLEVISLSNGITAVNVLDLEDYLLGVVPSEMPSSWHQEALKAQAVAARSYAWVHMGAGSKWKSEGFDLVPDVRDQAYKGLGAEAASTARAVWQTRGLILKNADKVQAGFYRAWVGDSEENLNIRKTRVPQARLEQLTGIKDIVGVTVLITDAQGNANSIQIMGAKKSRQVYGIALARMLGLATAGILDVREEGPNWLFTYRGPGNGSRGMSQHGANTLATNGWRFDQILMQYYQDSDGKLRLDYIDHFRPMVPMFAGRKPPKEPALTFSKGSLVETDGDASARSKAAAESTSTGTGTGTGTGSGTGSGSGRGTSSGTD
jgi:stage II sporulation protein D